MMYQCCISVYSLNCILLLPNLGFTNLTTFYTYFCPNTVCKQLCYTDSYVLTSPALSLLCSLFSVGRVNKVISKSFICMDHVHSDLPRPGPGTMSLCHSRASFICLAPTITSNFNGWLITPPNIKPFQSQRLCPIDHYCFHPTSPSLPLEEVGAAK